MIYEKFLLETLSSLAGRSGEDCAKYWVERKIEFFVLFQGGAISNTRFGLNFFTQLLNMIETGERVTAINQSDKVFNILAEKGKNE